MAGGVYPVNLCNDTITVFNAHVDAASGGNVYTPTVIHGVSWYATDAVSIDTSKGGLIAANKVTVRIPADADTNGKAYADPLTYANADDVTALWTLAEGDIIVKAAVEIPDPAPTEDEPTDGDDSEQEEPNGDDSEQGDEPTPEPTPEPTSEPTPTWTPAALKAAYADCMTVLAVTDNRRAPNAPHWRVTGA